MPRSDRTPWRIAPWIALAVALGLALVFLPRSAHGQSGDFRVLEGFAITEGARAVWPLNLPPRPGSPPIGLTEWSSGNGGYTIRWTAPDPFSQLDGVLGAGSAPPKGEIRLSIGVSTTPPGARIDARITVPRADGTRAVLSVSSVSPAGSSNAHIEGFALTPTETGGSFLSYRLDGDARRGVAVAAIFDDTGITVARRGTSTFAPATLTGTMRTVGSSQTWRFGAGFEAEAGFYLGPRFSWGTGETVQHSVQDVRIAVSGVGARAVSPPLTVTYDARFTRRTTEVTVGAFGSWTGSDGSVVFGAVDVGMVRAQYSTRYRDSLRMGDRPIGTTRAQTFGGEASAFVLRAGIGIAPALSDTVSVYGMVFGDYRAPLPTLAAGSGLHASTAPQASFNIGFAVGITIRF